MFVKSSDDKKRQFISIFIKQLEQAVVILREQSSCIFAT